MPTASSATISHNLSTTTTDVVLTLVNTDGLGNYITTVPTGATYWRDVEVTPRTYASGTAAGHYAVQAALYASMATTTYRPPEEVCCDCVWCASNVPTARADATIYTATYQPPVRLTPEERQAAEEADRAAYERAENARHERRRAAEVAEQRAGDVLRSLLTPAQITEMETWQTITVTGSEGNRFSLAIDHCDGNIRWLDDDDEVRGQFCAHPHRYMEGGPLPLFDVIAGQILALTADERSLVAVANHFSGAMPRYPEVSEPAPRRRRRVPW